jgi:anionic cell wall polymer biosynthesis LytR-Cps2A-Psr (LCP) family protein
VSSHRRRTSDSRGFGLTMLDRGSSTPNEPTSLTPQPQAPVAPGPRARRKAVRDSVRSEHQRLLTRRGLLLGGAVLALILLIVGVAALIPSRGNNKGTSASGRPQTTLLVQLIDAKGYAVASALTGHDVSTQTGAVVTVPQHLVSDVAGEGAVQFGSARLTGVRNASADALRDEIGVIVDGSWTLNAAGLASMVNAVGGVTVDVDVNVDTKQANGTTVVAVPAGKAQNLNGASAAAFAMYSLSSDPDAVGLARFDAVWTQLVTKLPSTSAAVQAMLGGVGANGKSTFDNAKLADYLETMHQDAVADHTTYDTIPTQSIDTGYGVSYRVDQDSLKTLIANDFADSVPQPVNGITGNVYVQNGVGSAVAVRAARTELINAGLQFTDGGTAAKAHEARSLIMINDANPASITRGQYIAKALHLPATDVAVAPLAQNVADVIVILGADFKS